MSSLTNMAIAVDRYRFIVRSQSLQVAKDKSTAEFSPPDCFRSASSGRCWSSSPSRWCPVASPSPSCTRPSCWASSSWWWEFQQLWHQHYSKNKNARLEDLTKILCSVYRREKCQTLSSHVRCLHTPSPRSTEHRYRRYCSASRWDQVTSGTRCYKLNFDCALKYLLIEE